MPIENETSTIDNSEPPQNQPSTGSSPENNHQSQSGTNSPSDSNPLDQQRIQAIRQELGLQSEPSIQETNIPKEKTIKELEDEREFLEEQLREKDEEIIQAEWKRILERGRSSVSITSIEDIEEITDSIIKTPETEAQTITLLLRQLDEFGREDKYQEDKIPVLWEQNLDFGESSVSLHAEVVGNSEKFKVSGEILHLYGYEEKLSSYLRNTLGIQEPKDGELEGPMFVRGSNGTLFQVSLEGGYEGDFEVSVKTRDSNGEKSIFGSSYTKEDEFSELQASQESISKALIDFGEVFSKVLAAEIDCNLPAQEKSLNASFQVEPLFLGPHHTLLNKEQAVSYPAPTEDTELTAFEKSETTFAEIGGQEKAIAELQVISNSISRPELFTKWGTKPPKGIILHGPPGTGKTLLAKALAAESGADFLPINLSDFESKYYSESETKLQRIFDKVKKSERKTILFFDEIDSIAGHRTNSPDNFSDRTHNKIISVMLKNLNGIVGNDNLIVVGATNRLDSIDDALKRAGRFDKLVEVPLPTGPGRKEIMDIHMRKAEATAQRSLFDQVKVDEIVPRTDSYSGADLSEIIRRTLEDKIRVEISGQEPNPVTTEDVLDQVKKYERKTPQRNPIGFKPSGS